MPIQRWRSPVALQVSWAVYALADAAVATIFFPVWFGAPVAVVLGGFYLSAAVLGAKVTVDPEAGLLMLRLGLLSRRIGLADVTAVLVDGDKVSVGRAKGGEISFYPWRSSLLGRWLRFPSVASDIGHAISQASALARSPAHRGGTCAPGAVSGTDGAAEPGTTAAPGGFATATAAPEKPPAASASAPRQPVWRARFQYRRDLANVFVACAGAVTLAAAFLVRLHWHNPAMKTLAVILALWLGIFGVFYLLVALFMLLSRRVAA